MARQATPFLVKRLHPTLWTSGKTDEADAVALQWIKGHPTDVAVRAYLAEQFMSRKDYRAAATQLLSALKHAPDNIRLLNNLGRSLNALGDPKAVDYAARAYAQAPTNAEVADTYGRVLVAQGDAARGVEVLRQAVDLAPGDADKRMRLARALLNAGNNAGRQEGTRNSREGGGSAGSPRRGGEAVEGTMTRDWLGSSPALDTLHSTTITGPRRPKGTDAKASTSGPGRVPSGPLTAAPSLSSCAGAPYAIGGRARSCPIA